MKALCRLLSLPLQNGRCSFCGRVKLNKNTSAEFTTASTVCAAPRNAHSPCSTSTWLAVFVFFLSGWSVAPVTPHCASGTSRQVSVYTSSWATWRQCAASSMTGGGWSAVPTTSWSKCGTPRRKPASTRCRATPTECTRYRWAASDTHCTSNCIHLEIIFSSSMIRCKGWTWTSATVSINQYSNKCKWKTCYIVIKRT